MREGRREGGREGGKKEGGGEGEREWEGRGTGLFTVNTYTDCRWGCLGRWREEVTIVT